MSTPRHPEDGPGDADVDRAFREIVAGLRGPSAPSVGPAPGARPASSGVNPPPVLPSHRAPGTPEGMATDHRSYEPPEEEDHFVPPEPPPLPAGDLHFWGIVIGLVVGPLLVVLSAVVPVLGRGWTTVGVLLAVAGFVLLVLRQPRRYRPDDGDHGARV